MSHTRQMAIWMTCFLFTFTWTGASPFAQTSAHISGTVEDATGGRLPWSLPLRSRGPNDSATRTDSEGRFDPPEPHRG